MNPLRVSGYWARSPGDNCRGRHPLVEWAGAFHDSCHGLVDDCDRPRGATCFKVRSAILVPLAAIGAWFIGSVTGQAVGGLSPVGFIIGASLSPTMLFVYLLVGLERLRTEWQSIASRAVASWIAAIGIMMLTYELARHRLPMRPH